MTDKKPRIYVLAGTNGAGKSSIAGAMLRELGVEYFNPDEVAARIQAINLHLSLAEAESAAWHQGKRLLERAMDERLDYAFETTLGGRTITAMLERAMDSGVEVRIWYVGLVSPELHLTRVRARVLRGGHDVSEKRIRERYARSLLNLIQLLPKLTELRLYDNSHEADPHTGAIPEPSLILHFKGGKLRSLCEPASIPAWAKPVVITALQISAR